MYVSHMMLDGLQPTCVFMTGMGMPNSIITVQAPMRHACEGKAAAGHCIKLATLASTLDKVAEAELPNQDSGTEGTPGSRGSALTSNVSGGTLAYTYLSTFSMKDHSRGTAGKDMHPTCGAFAKSRVLSPTRVTLITPCSANSMCFNCI